jgi:hypothetical protein
MRSSRRKQPRAMQANNRKPSRRSGLAQSEFARRPQSVVAVLALVGALASGSILVVLVLLVWPVARGAQIATSARTWSLTLSLATCLVVALLLLVWYLSPHLVHRVRVLRPLKSAVAPGTSVAAQAEHARATPSLLRLTVRGLLVLLVVAPVLAAALLEAAPLTPERLEAACALDGVVALGALGGMGYLVWRWLHVRARSHP